MEETYYFELLEGIKYTGNYLRQVHIHLIWYVTYKILLCMKHSYNWYNYYTEMTCPKSTVYFTCKNMVETMVYLDFIIF